MWQIKLPLTQDKHTNLLRKWLISVGVDPSQTFSGNSAVSEYALKLEDVFGGGRYLLQKGLSIKYTKKNDMGYPIRVVAVHQDDAEAFLWGKEIKVVINLDDAIEDACEADSYIEEDGRYICNYEGCDKSLKTERGIIAHIEKVHG